jgi:hypothetical protein
LIVKPVIEQIDDLEERLSKLEQEFRHMKMQEAGKKHG